MLTKNEHLSFDAEFLYNMVDAGVNVSEYPLKRLDQGPEVIARQFGDLYFSFRVDQDFKNNELDWLKLAAKRAAHQMMYTIQEWRETISLYIEDYLDNVEKT